jgi:cytochrome c2
MRHVGIRTVVALSIVVGVAPPSPAVVQFYMQYKKDFLDKHPDKEYAALVNKGTNRCFVCHQGKKSKKNHNPFGEHLVTLLDRKKDFKDKEKISAMLKKVVAMHVDSKDDKSETYLDRIKASKWPGGELAELQREPDKKETGSQ